MVTVLAKLKCIDMVLLFAGNRNSQLTLLGECVLQHSLSSLNDASVIGTLLGG